jgi:hypothetical protein
MRSTVTSWKPQETGQATPRLPAPVRTCAAPPAAPPAAPASFATTPHRYVLQRRMLRARSSAEQRRLAVDDRHRDRFASHGHFSTVFRAATGTTPSAYRRGAQGPDSP